MSNQPIRVGPTVDGLTPYERARRNGLLDRWLIAGTPRQHPYPCMCRARRGECTEWCSCWGRLDNLALMPEFCCGRRLAQARATQTPAGLIDQGDTDGPETA